jgi:hypothetical protein
MKHKNYGQEFFPVLRKNIRKTYTECGWLPQKQKHVLNAAGCLKNKNSVGAGGGGSVKKKK